MTIPYTVTTLDSHFLNQKNLFATSGPSYSAWNFLPLILLSGCFLLTFHTSGQTSLSVRSLVKPTNLVNKLLHTVSWHLAGRKLESALCQLWQHQPRVKYCFGSRALITLILPLSHCVSLSCLTSLPPIQIAIIILCTCVVLYSFHITLFPYFLLILKTTCKVSRVEMLPPFYQWGN